jgi:hypothetical protein
MKKWRIWTAIIGAFLAGIVTNAVLFATWPIKDGALWQRDFSDPLDRLPNASRTEVETAFARLRSATIAFNAPPTMEFDETNSIELLLSLTEPIEELRKQLTMVGERHGFDIRASGQMEASLRPVRDSVFKVLAVTPEVQNIRATENTRWLWRITPLDWGRQELQLVVSALYQVEGRDGRRAVRTFQHNIVVNVTNWARAKVFFRNNWQWAWTAILLPVLGWLGWLGARLIRKKSGFDP